MRACSAHGEDVIKIQLLHNKKRLHNALRDSSQLVKTSYKMKVIVQNQLPKLKF